MTQQEGILLKVREFACTQMKNNDAAHDPEHLLRVVELTRRLCRAYPQADGFRAELLAWLHDLNDDKLASNVGTDSVKAFLQQISLPEQDIFFVLGAIGYISYRKHPKLSEDIPLEIRIVQDADRMDAMGAVGIARTFAYGGAKGRSLGESLSHFDEKLLLLYDLLSTPEAKRMALPRHECLKAFYAAYQQEIS